ncbi:MAG: DUF3043 domain-containing protein [Mycobacteriaceae bacterium]
MKLLRRRTTDADTSAGTSAPPPEPAVGKGRPTPTRREAESRRRGPVAPPPTTQREAYKRSKATQGAKPQRRKANTERRERMMAGDDQYVLARDRGPARALVRDVVDARRNITGLFMPLALLVVLSFLYPPIQGAVALAMFAMMLVMAIEGIFLARLVSRRVHERFPDEAAGTVKLGWYAFIRASQIRKLRAPRPQVKPGDAV